MTTMNALESLLNDIGAFNSQAYDLQADAGVMKERHGQIVARAKALGITKPNAIGMLAKVKCEVVMPDRGETEPAAGSTLDQIGSQVRQAAGLEAAE